MFRSIFKLVGALSVGIFLLHLAFDHPLLSIQRYIRSFGLYGLMVPGLPVYIVSDRSRGRDGRKVGILTGDWPYCYNPTGEVFLIPKGFETDFASIPNLALFYVNPTSDNVIEAAVIHDWLYSIGGSPKEQKRLQADTIFEYALKEQGVNILRRSIMYYAVRFGGSDAFSVAGDVRLRDLNNLRAPAIPVQYPSPSVIDVLKGCDEFLEKHWYSPERGPVGHYLMATSPGFNF